MIGKGPGHVKPDLSPQPHRKSCDLPLFLLIFLFIPQTGAIPQNSLVFQGYPCG
jgi:hypothetical protein